MNLAEFGSWGLSQGQVANPAPNNRFMGECVSLIQQYLNKVLNIPFQAHGNAKDWEYNVPNGFTKLSAGTPLKRGDILVYGANYGGGYGHIGLIDVNMKYYDQNGIKSRRIGYRDIPLGGYRCILRYNGKIPLGINTNKWYARYKTNATINVHSTPTLGNNVKLYPRGTVFDICQEQNGFGLSPSGWVKLSFCTKI